MEHPPTKLNKGEHGFWQEVFLSSYYLPFFDITYTVFSLSCVVESVSKRKNERASHINPSFHFMTALGTISSLGNGERKQSFFTHRELYCMGGTEKDF